ncbi:unnamed protein product, partial [Arctogadus glacialis]
MEFRLPLFVCVTLLPMLTLFVLESGASIAGMFSAMPLRKLCKFCDLERSSCNGTGTCFSNCSITSICQEDEEICVAIWRRNESSFSVETLCHDPSQRLYGVRLEDSNNTACVMTEKNITGGPAFVCSCVADECNDHMSFVPVVDVTQEVPMASVILISLLPLPVLLCAVVAMFYWYRVARHRHINQEWENGRKKRKAKAGGLDCSDACAIMMDDDGSDSSSTHANNLNHNTEPLPIELDMQ